MSNNSDRHRRVPRRGADIRAELSARELEREYPRRDENGGIAWACCESSIGPVCGHLRSPGGYYL